MGAEDPIRTVSPLDVTRNYPIHLPFAIRPRSCPDVREFMGVSLLSERERERERGKKGEREGERDRQRDRVRRERVPPTSYSLSGASPSLGALCRLGTSDGQADGQISGAGAHHDLVGEYGWEKSEGLAP